MQIEDFVSADSKLKSKEESVTDDVIVHKVGKNPHGRKEVMLLSTKMNQKSLNKSMAPGKIGDRVEDLLGQIWRNRK